MAVISIMQPAYLPWSGYIQRILASDLHVELDHVKIDRQTKTTFTNRNRILTAKGAEWLTIPYYRHSSPGLIINELMIDNSSGWQNLHWVKIRDNYKKAPYFKEHAPFFENFFHTPFERVTDAISTSTDYILKYFQNTTPIIKSSEMGKMRNKSDLVLDICQKMEASTYLAGPFSRDYLEMEPFNKAGIKVLYHDFEPREYPQMREGFTPYLSVLDLMMNVDRATAREIITMDIPKILGN